MILFLDFDGVLHPQYDGQQVPLEVVFCHLSRFEAVMRCFPNVDIVISSTWREQFDLSSLRARFSSDIALRIIGVTPLSADLPPANKPKTRECEIINWLQVNNRQGEEWIAIDDCAWQFNKHKNRLIVCKGGGFKSEVQHPGFQWMSVECCGEFNSSSV